MIFNTEHHVEFIVMCYTVHLGSMLIRKLLKMSSHYATLISTMISHVLSDVSWYMQRLCAKLKIYIYA